MRVELLQGAEADLLEAYVRLEEQRTGLGERFYRTLDFALERMRQHPQMAPVYLGDYRRPVLRPFGFGVFYTITGARVMVGAILDLRQDPEAIARRLLP
jgi:plasmid stabilization system protein ParE